MKKLLSIFLSGLAFAGASVAEAQVRGRANTEGKTRLAVVEFSTGGKASVMTAEAKRHLQASIAFALVKTNKFDVADVRRTRDASQGNLAAINGDTATTAAAKAGKALAASYILTGSVVEYDTKGSATIRFRLVEAATGKVKHSGEITQKSTSSMRTDGATEMQLKVLKPRIEKLTADVAAKF